MGSDHLVTKLLLISPEDAVIEKIGDRRGEIFRRTYLNKLNPFRGARQLVEKIVSHNGTGHSLVCFERGSERTAKA